MSTRLASTHVLKVLVLSIAAIAAGPASATSIEVGFNGIITNVIADGSDGSVAVGTPFVGYLTFDDAATDVDPSASTGTYLLATPPTAFHVNVGHYSLSASASGVRIDVFDDLAPDEVFVVANNASVQGPLGAALTSAFFQFDLSDFSETALASDDLTGVPWHHADWDQLPFFFQINMANADVFNAIGTINLMVLPEPSTLVLLGAGLGALGRRRAAR